MSHKLASDRATGTPLYLYFLFWSGPLLGLLIAMNAERVRINQAFNDDFDRAVAHISQNISTYDVALEGFANFLALAGDIEDTEIRAYAQGIRDLYPDIYMFEITSRISHSQKDFFERSMRAKGYRDFSIHGFDYKKRRPIAQLPERDDYYPIRFIEPETPDNVSLLGLDLGFGSQVLVETILAAMNKPRAIASRPFTLMEGGRGYVLYRPVALTPRQANSRYPVSFAMLVVRGDTLLPAWLQQDDRFAVSLSYASSLDGDLERYLIEPADKHDLLIPALYSLSRIVAIESESHPFTLKLVAEVSLSEVRWSNIVIPVLLGGLLFWILCSQLEIRRKRGLREQQERKQLYLKANYDPLTGLPNLNLLNDLARQIQYQAQRKQQGWGVLFLDLDQFKSVNDKYGHDTGDQLLNQVADRLRVALRAEDTAARLHGDEFVVLLPELKDSEAITVVVAKLQAAFTEPFVLSGQTLMITCSIGHAIAPDDGADLDALLKQADVRMYQQKQRDAAKSLIY